MSNPQQPELARSRRGASTADSVKARPHDQAPRGDGGLGPVPEDNVPGHHPDHEPDKPRRRPHVPPVHHRFEFDFDPKLASAARVFGVREHNAYVDVDGDRLTIRFGRWLLRTHVSNVADATITGPFRWWKVIGPPHLSFADRGITFATNTERGVCIEFREPVTAMLPNGLLRHPGATVTVHDADDLVELLTRRG